MARFAVPTTALVVGEWQKRFFLFLRNHKALEKLSRARVERVRCDVNPPTHEQGTEPNRSLAFRSADRRRRSGLDDTDWHDLDEHRFTRDVATALEGLVPRTKKDQGPH